MAILRPKDVRKMEDKDFDKRLEELKLELSKERANINIGAPVTSPGRVKEIRKTVARILTIRNERNKNRISKIKPTSINKEVKERLKSEERQKPTKPASN